MDYSGPERSPAEILLDEALNLGARELDALTAGNVEEAEELCARRAKLLEESWALNDEQGADLRSRLLAMQSLQERLMERGQALQKEIREGLKRSRQQSQRMRGYGLAVRQALMQ